jgi:hypothetical protein
MRFGNDDQAGQQQIEQERAMRRRRIQLVLLGPRKLLAEYQRVVRTWPQHVHASAGVPQDRTDMIDAVLAIEQAARDAQA